MKKVLCILLALTSIFCLAGCEDGKCDNKECQTKKNVKVYTIADQKEKLEFCPTCALAYMAEHKVILNEVED